MKIKTVFGIGLVLMLVFIMIASNTTNINIEGYDNPISASFVSESEPNNDFLSAQLVGIDDRIQAILKPGTWITTRLKLMTSTTLRSG